jgi:hypothetical protein
MSDIVKFMERERDSRSDMCVEDLFFLADLRALGVPWVRERVAACRSHDDVRRLWTLIRAWGPNHEDVDDLFALSPQPVHVGHAVERVRRLTGIVEGWRS